MASLSRFSRDSDRRRDRTCCSRAAVRSNSPRSWSRRPIAFSKKPRKQGRRADKCDTFADMPICQKRSSADFGTGHNLLAAPLHHGLQRQRRRVMPCRASAMQLDVWQFTLRLTVKNSPAPPLFYSSSCALQRVLIQRRAAKTREFYKHQSARSRWYKDKVSRSPLVRIHPTQYERLCRKSDRMYTCASGW